MKTQRYKELDAMRGFAALFVMFFHYTTHTPHSLSFLELGVTGVDLFFIISGFVIFMSINKVRSAKEFMINRFARLYPTYWTVVTFTTLLILLANHLGITKEDLSLYKYMANMTMFQHYLRAGNIDGTYWTMIIEMVFYIFIVLLFRTGLLKNILSIGLALLIVTTFWDIWIKNHSLLLYKQIRYLFPLINHFPLFLAGIIFYKIANQSTRDYGLYVLLVICLPVQIMLYNNGGSAMNYISQLNYAIMVAIYFVLFLLFINHKLAFIVNRPALFFGRISFALYLIHQFLSIDFLIPILTKQVQLNFFIAAAIAFTVSVGISTLITYYIELPLNKYFKDLFKKKMQLNENAY
ncbi:MAG: acyltransferase family protein [Bacteroidia bacterium]